VRVIAPGRRHTGRRRLGKFISSPTSIDSDQRHIPGHGTFPRQVTPAISDTFGGYALIVDLGTYGQRFGLRDCPHVPADGAGCRFRPMLSTFSSRAWRPFYLFKRLGVKGARMEMSGEAADDPEAADR